MIEWSGRRLRRAFRSVLALVLLVAVCPAAAQSFDGGAGSPLPPAAIPGLPPGPPLDLPSLGAPEVPPPSDATPPLDPALGTGSGDLGLPEAAAPFAPSDTLTEPSFGLDKLRIGDPELVLTAKLTADGDSLRSGLVWRVFAANPGPDGRLPMVASAKGGDASFRLPPGSYLVHCWFGYADRTVRVDLAGPVKQEAVVLDAGGLKLLAQADDRPLPDADVRFDVLAPETDARGERRLVAGDVKPGDLVRLPAGTYHVVSRYGGINAVTSAEVVVTSGKLSEVTLYQRAAEVTLKLVGEPGGEAIADTRWSILTPGGDVVSEGVGAFPSFILAEGDYTAIAKHENGVYQRVFGVETGRDDEVEVLATQASMQPGN
ncbi:hypothetical protein [Chthonobacter rhizosphaerae]|uniref:hypothetical protein n=1 Tax=Chthonobacter rhizosphaerae TaxID=2735553 RepID=UPI0015EEBA0E|nr:hypothetical protein [Chthonobacter rhizosphaerae]